MSFRKPEFKLHLVGWVEIIIALLIYSFLVNLIDYLYSLIN